MWAIPIGTVRLLKKKNQVKSPSIWSRTPNSVRIRQSGRTGNRGVTLPTSDPSESIKSESHAPAEPNEALLRISQDMARGLERLTAPKASIYMVRRHGAEEFHGSNMEESDKVELWLEKLQRVVKEV